MYKLITLLLMGLLIVISCKQDKKKSGDPTNIKPSSISYETRVFPEFEWSSTEMLKLDLIENIKGKKDSIDYLIVIFLNDYRSLVEKFNNILYDLKSYDSLNTWAYTDAEVYQIAKDFEKQVNKNGFLLSSTEGMIYIAESADYIKKDILDIIDPLSKEYLNQYCNQVENICCDDAAIIISEEELVNRIYNWGELLGKVQGLKYSSLVDGHYHGNLSLLYEGQENTPSFDMETGIFSESLIDQMKFIIKKHPESKAAIDFQEFIDLLASEDYKKTDKLSSYIVNKTNHTSQL